MIRKGEGIIIRVVRYADSDAVVTLYTKEYGKKSFFVKGGFSARSTKKALLKEGYWVEFVFYSRASRQLQKLTDIHLLKHFFQLTTNPIKNCVLMTMLETFKQVVQEEEVPDPDLYSFLVQQVTDLEVTGCWQQTWWFYHKALLSKVGYGYSEPLTPEPLLPTKAFIQTAYKVYNEFSKNLEEFKIPKSFEVLKQLLERELEGQPDGDTIKS